MIKSKYSHRKISEMLKPLDESELSLMRESCQLAAKTLLLVGENLQAGITTEDINILVHEFITSHGAYPSPLNYKGFPKSVCTSRNEIACHGIPNKHELLLDGDIINVDISTYFPKENGFHGDTSAMFYIGTPSDEAKHLVETTRKSLDKAIQAVKPGLPLGIVGHTIQSFVESEHCSVVKDFVGHGVGRVFHGPPAVLHYGPPTFGPVMTPGMIFTIEPIVNLGTDECSIVSDGWTVITRDGSLSAQFEHTILVTTDGCEVLTERKEKLKNSEVFNG